MLAVILTLLCLYYLSINQHDQETLAKNRRVLTSETFFLVVAERDSIGIFVF